MKSQGPTPAIYRCKTPVPPIDELPPHVRRALYELLATVCVVQPPQRKVMHDPTLRPAELTWEMVAWLQGKLHQYATNAPAKDSKWIERRHRRGRVAAYVLQEWLTTRDAVAEALSHPYSGLN